MGPITACWSAEIQGKPLSIALCRLLLDIVKALKIDLFLYRCSAQHTGDNSPHGTSPCPLGGSRPPWERAICSSVPFLSSSQTAVSRSSALTTQTCVKYNLWKAPTSTSLCGCLLFESAANFLSPKWKARTLGRGRKLRKVRLEDKGGLET